MNKEKNKIKKEYIILIIIVIAIIMVDQIIKTGRLSECGVRNRLLPEISRV